MKNARASARGVIEATPSTSSKATKMDELNENDCLIVGWKMPCKEMAISFAEEADFLH